LQRAVAKLEGQKRRLLDLLVDGTIDKATYAERREQLQIEIAVKRSEANDADLDGMELGAVLDFAEHLMRKREEDVDSRGAERAATAPGPAIPGGVDA